MDNNVVAKHILDVAVGLEKKSKAELITELSDIFDNASKIDLNSKENIASLKNLAKAFETIFAKAGNKSINFADLIEMPPPAMFAEMGKIAATSFWDAWNSVSGGNKGISQDMLKSEFNQLKKHRAELIKQQKSLPRKQEKLDALSDILYAEQDEFHAFSKDELKAFGKSVDEVALDMTDALSRTMDELSGLKGGTKEFEDALVRAYERLNDVMRMSRTLAKQPDLISDKTILADYDFDLIQEDYVESLMDYEKAFTNMMFALKKEFDSIPAKLKEIDDKILQIQNSGIELVEQTEAKNGLKTLNEIEDAYKRILTHDKKRAVRPDQKKVGKIEKSLAFDPSASSQGIQTLYDQYLEAQASGIWEEEYQALLKYVRLYEEYLNSTNKTHRNKVTRADNPFTPLYEQLKPMADNAQNALQNIVNMAKDQPLVGMGGAGTGGTGDGSDEATNAKMIAEAKRMAAEKEAEAKRDAEAKADAERRAAEEIEKQAQAEKEKAAALKQQRIEEEKLAKVAEKKRLAEEAAVGVEEKRKTTLEGSTKARQEEVDATKELLEILQIIDSKVRENSKPGDEVEMATRINTKTKELDRWVVGNRTNAKMPGGTVDDDYTAFGGRTPFNMGMHTHWTDLAVPSPKVDGYTENGDFDAFKDRLSTQRIQLIRAMQEALFLDFSKISKESLNELINDYNALGAEVGRFLDTIPRSTKHEAFGGESGVNEAIQAMLKDGFVKLVSKYPGFATWIEQPVFPGAMPRSSIIPSGANIPDVMRQYNETKATKQPSLVEKYDQSADEIKKKYQEIIALQDQIDEYERKTEKTSIDIDPWNATKEQKDQIVAAWREYQQVVKEIAAMPIVETEDDERRLLELKARAVSLYETMRQGHLNDVLGDGYAKEYGLSIEDGKQMHLDMQDEPRREFDKSLDGLRDKLDDAYTSAQQLDEEMFVMMLRADDDNVESFYERIRQDAEAAKPVVEAVNDAVAETKAITQQSDLESDDDAETLAKENGALEDKLELLRDIAEQYGNNVSQKQRDRLEELNQKDMNEGLTPKEDERYWELSEQIDEADNALEEFGETYDRIIVKLANGKKIEVLPDDKGLRTLAKIDEEYGESYNGIEIEDVIFERIQKEVVSTERAVDSLNDSLEETKVLTHDSDGVGIGDVSSAELEAAVTKTEALQDELEQKNKELANKDAEVARIQAENEIKLQAEADEKVRLQDDLNVKNQQLADVQHENELYDTALAKATEESNAKDGVIRELREQLANVKTGMSEEQTSIGMDELKRVLGEVVYNVKIAHDDTDKEANKIAIDESVLEQTLNRVFANVLNPEVEQASAEPKNEPWALEKTLLSVKEALDGIHTNTAKTELVEVAPASTEVGNVLATENTLAAIKTAVEAINKKVVKGTKSKTSEGGGKKSGAGKKNAENYAGSQYFPEKLKTQTMQLAKFRAQLMTTGKLTDNVDAQIYELLDALAQVKSGPDFSQWAQKFQQLKTSVGITDIFDKAEDKEATASYQQLIEFQKTRNKLELQYEKAQDGSALKQFYAEQLAQMDSVIAKQEEMLDNEEYEAKLAKIREEQARKLGEVEAKAADKAAKKTAADQKKLVKRQAMTGKAGSAIGRAESVWLEAEGLEQAKLPEGFKKQVSEYYDALDKLRLKRHEINTSDVVTEQQQNELIQQTAEVNKLTEAISPLIAQYERLSGDNTEVIGASVLGPNATLEEYEQGLRQAVMTATNGKAQIKSFDHETKTLTYTLKTGKHEFTEYTAEVRRLDQQYTSTAGKTKRMETFLEATKRKMKELTSYFSGMAVFNRVGQELRRGIQYVREIDLALTELKKVTDETEETYDRFLETAAKTADKVGSTIQKVVSSTADWARLGYSMKEAAEFAESTQILMNVSEFTDVSQATDTLISAVQAFGYTAETSMDVVDLLNTIGKQNCRNYIVIYG